MPSALGPRPVQVAEPAASVFLLYVESTTLLTVTQGWTPQTSLFPPVSHFPFQEGSCTSPFPSLPSLCPGQASLAVCIALGKTPYQDSLPAFCLPHLSPCVAKGSISESEPCGPRVHVWGRPLCKGGAQRSPASSLVINNRLYS